MHCTATTAPLHYDYNCSYTTPHDIQPAVVGEVTDQVTTATIVTIPKNTTNHLSVHQWIRSAIRDSQQPGSPIGFLFLKLSPPPCAALLVIPNFHGISHPQLSRTHLVSAIFSRCWRWTQALACLRSLSCEVYSFDQYDWEHIISSPSSVVTLVVLAGMGRAWFRFRIRIGRSGKFADPYGTKVPWSSIFDWSLAFNGKCTMFVVCIPRTPSRTETMLLWQKSHVVSQGRKSRKSVASPRHSFHVFCSFATTVKKARKKCEKGMKKKTWKKMMFSFWTCCALFADKYTERMRPATQKSHIVVKVAWKMRF